MLKTIQNQGNQYGNSDLFRGKKLLLEFVSANPVGPMNVVNARAAAIGDTLARIFKAAGYDVATEYYVNDAGNQTNVFARSLEARYLQVAGIDCEFPEDGYPGEYVTELAEVLWNENPGLLNLPEEERLEVIRQWGIDQMVEMQRADLAQFGVEFDRWFSEQSLHKEQALEKVMALLDERGFIFQAEDATWFKSTEFGDDKDRVLVKSDGSYTYVTADIAYHYDKLKRGFTKLLDIWGPDHHGYIARMKAAIQALGYSEDTLEVLILQYVSLLRDGQQVKMSKRAGEFVTMQDLLDEVGKDAARYFFLMRSPESHLDFDLTLASEQTNENPVFYIQYAYARICSILRQAQEMEVEIVNIDQAPLHVLTEDIEIDLMKKLADLPDEIRIAAENARLGQPEIGLGFIPGGGGTQRLPRLIGVAKAKELIFSGKMISAQEALAIGLVNKVVPVADLLTESQAMAASFIKNSSVILEFAKIAIDTGIQLDLKSGLELEIGLWAESFATEDHHEGIVAFIEKRPPQFKGR